MTERREMTSREAHYASSHDGWREAVIDSLVVACIYRAEHDGNPRKAVDDLIQWEQDIALDPRVSSSAQALIDRGAREALERAAKLIEPKGPCPRSPWIQGVGPDPHMETAVIVWNAHTAIAQRLRALAAELPEGEK